MRNKFLSFLTVLAALVFFAGVTPAQNPTGTVTVRNGQFNSATEYQFDIYLLRTGGTAFELGGCQVALIFNNAIVNGGTLSSTYVAGSADAAIVAAGQTPANPNVASTKSGGYAGRTYRVFKLAGKLPSGGAGSGAVISNSGNGTRVGTFKITNTVAFAASGTVDSISFVPLAGQAFYGYATKISAYVGGTNTDVSSGFTLDHSSGIVNPLPVELSSFTANTTGRTVVLNWKTATEMNSSKFEIQRSTIKTGSTERTWTTVAEVSASGSSNSVKEYTYADKRLQTGKYAYRLKMIDNDGTFEYSKNEVEGEVGLPKEFALSQNYPNPFNPSTRIEYQVPVDARVVVELYSITGEKIANLVNTEVSGGYYSYDLNATQLGLSSGMYLYRVAAVNKATGQAFNQVKKMMMLK